MSPSARLAAIAAATLVAVLAVLQVVLPRLASDDAEERLTERGGTADVSIGAWPAARLLLGADGDSLRVRARGIEVEPTRDERPFDRLDGFGDVDVLIEDSTAGPLELREVRISRNGGDTYDFEIDAAASPRDLIRFAGSQLGGFGGLVGGLAGGSIPAGDEPIPFTLEAVVTSDDGRPDVIESDGAVAGIPLGPLSGLVVSAVAAQI